MYRLLLTFVFISLFTAVANATERAEPPLPELKNIVVAGPYCGVYSLHACLDAFDIHPNPEELFIPEFVGLF